MKAIASVALLAGLLGVAAGAGAQCRILLPQEPPRPECTTRAAAAYDFAFCSVSYFVGSVGASPLPDASGESEAQAMRVASNAYARVSLALSDENDVKTNIDQARRYFDSLHKQGEKVTPTLTDIGRKCQAINQHHSEILEEVAREIRARRR